MTEFSEGKILLSVAEAAAYLGMTKNMVYELTETEGFPVMRFRRRKFIYKDKLNRWIEENAEKRIF